MSEVSLDLLEKKRKKLEDGNNRSYNELRQKVGPQFQMDTGDMRRELFYTKLVEWGIVTQEQALEFEITFHEKVEAALNGAWEEVREAERGAALTVVKKPDTLLGPNGRPLT